MIKLTIFSESLEDFKAVMSPFDDCLLHLNARLQPHRKINKKKDAAYLHLPSLIKLSHKSSSVMSANNERLVRVCDLSFASRVQNLRRIKERWLIREIFSKGRREIGLSGKTTCMLAFHNSRPTCTFLSQTQVNKS